MSVEGFVFLLQERFQALRKVNLTLAVACLILIFEVDFARGACDLVWQKSQTAIALENLLGGAEHDSLIS